MFIFHIKKEALGREGGGLARAASRKGGFKFPRTGLKPWLDQISCLPGTLFHISEPVSSHVK